MESGNALLDDYVLAATGVERPKVCFLPTASGDADHYIVRFYRHFSAGALRAVARVAVPPRLRRARAARAPARAGPHLRRRRLRALDARRVARARARRRAARGVGGRRRDVRPERRLAVLVRAGADRVPRRAEPPPWPGSACSRAPTRCTTTRSRGGGRSTTPRSRAGMAPGWAADDGAALHFVGSGLARVVSSRRRRERLPGGAAWAASRSRRRWRWSTWGRRCSLVA